MRIELGATILLHPSSERIYHLPTWLGSDGGSWESLCGLDGCLEYALGGFLVERKLCGVCVRQAPALVVAPDHEAVDDGARWERSRIKPHHLQVLHRLYVDDGLSLEQLGELVYERLGYSSAHSCAVTINQMFRREGYEVRPAKRAAPASSVKPLPARRPIDPFAQDEQEAA